MLGYSEMTETVIWVQTTIDTEVQIRYWQKGKPETSRLTPIIRTSKENDHIALFRISNLPLGTRFEYELYLVGERVQRDYPLEFQTQPHWRWRTDPPVSVPSAAGTNPAATAAALPPEDPPGTRVRFQGLRVTP